MKAITLTMYLNLNKNRVAILISVFNISNSRKALFEFRYFCNVQVRIQIKTSSMTGACMFFNHESEHVYASSDQHS